ncbi:glycosyltransferase family 2 protein [Bacillus solitudinis]|uniref:glycosyltransferase family 2 protein n=1 Tax=Bacillus solitudinis TaxID=2014074 RepID=UPI000C240B58|nr:glycosyltransferase family 2 protein [Bacillus solitudinis]
MNKISIVIPAFNEEKSLSQTIQALRQLPYEKEIIVVNDGSSDKTGEIAEVTADFVLHVPSNNGKGNALQVGWKKASADYILCIDADLEQSAGEAIHLIRPLFENKADVVISKVKSGKKSGFGLIKRRARSIIYRNTGFILEAPLSGQRAFQRQWLPLLLKQRYIGFGVETQMSIDLLKAGATILEVETMMKHREMGKTWKGFRHRIKQWVEIEKNCKEVRS